MHQFNFTFILSTFVFLVGSGPSHALTQEIEEYEIGEIVEVESKSKWHPGIVFKIRRGPAYDVRYFSRETGERYENFFFPPEMRKTNGKGFEAVGTEFRTWISTKGTKAVAKLIFSDGVSVLLKRQSKAVVVPIDKLSDEDKAYVLEMKEFSQKIDTDNRHGPTPLKDLIGMSKDELLEKLQSDHEKLMSDMGKVEEGENSSSPKNRNENLDNLKKQLEMIDGSISKEQLEKLNDELEKFKSENVDADESAVENTEIQTEPVVGTSLEDGDFNFSLTIPPGFSPFENPNTTDTVIHSFSKESQASGTIPTMIEIHRLNLQLDPYSRKQITALEKQIGEPLTKTLIKTQADVPLEIWRVDNNAGHLGTIVGFTLLVPLQPEGLRVSIGGQRSDADQNLNYLKNIARSLKVSGDYMNPKGYRTPKIDQNKPTKSEPEAPISNPTTPLNGTNSYNQSRGSESFLDTYTIAAIVAIAGVLLIIIIKSVMGKSQKYP